MKTLAPITIGTYSVAVTIEDAGPSVMLYTAACGKTIEKGKHNHMGAHDHTAEQFQKDVDAFALKLAAIAAGKEQSRILKTNLLAG